MKIHLSKPEVKDLEEEPYELLARTFEHLAHHGWPLAEIYNRLRAMTHEPIPPAPEIVTVDDELIECSCCTKWLWLTDSWSPGDDALCSECNKEVTGRWKGPSIDPSKAPPPPQEQDTDLSIRPGCLVTWNDPDDGACSRTGTLVSAVSQGDALRILMDDGWEADVHASELELERLPGHHRQNNTQ